jgi:hypothetical protein
MATSFTWPVNFPAPTIAYQESNGELILRTPMDKGIAKQRNRGLLPTTMPLTFYLTTGQVSTLETFVHETIKGVYRFNFMHPRKKVEVEVRLIPDENGRLYNVSYLTPDHYSVTVNMEIMP